MHILPERLLWMGMALLTSVIVALSLAAMSSMPDLADNQRMGTEQAIASLQNESKVLDAAYRSGAVTKPFFSAEKETILDESEKLSKEL